MIHEPLQCGWKIAAFGTLLTRLVGGDSSMIALPIFNKSEHEYYHIESVASHLISGFFLFSFFLVFIVVITHTHTVYRAFDRFPTTMQCIDLKSFCNASLSMDVCANVFSPHVMSETLHYFYTFATHVFMHTIFLFHVHAFSSFHNLEIAISRVRVSR